MIKNEREGEMEKCKKGKKYNVLIMGHLIGWSGGDATGYSAEYYFDSEGRYLGPDHDGVEPLFNLEDYEVAAAAAALGRKGRAVNSPAQQQAARDNGKKGGRPKTARKGQEE
jgi:hypothetical protein